MSVQKAPTGIAALDEALRGGLPCGRGYMIAGGTFSDKEILARHIQFSALRRGHIGVYISCTKTYRQIIEEYLSRNQDIADFLRSDKCAIIDCYTLASNYEQDPHSTIPEDIRRNICLISDPLNLDQLFNADKSIKERIGFEAVTVVDSLSDQIVAASERRMPAHQIINHHRRCKEFFARKGGIMGIHLFNNEVRRERYKDYNEILDDMEDGTILLKESITAEGVRNKTVHVRIKSLDIDTPTFRYKLTESGIITPGNVPESGTSDKVFPVNSPSCVFQHIEHFHGFIGSATNSPFVQGQQTNIQYSTLNLGLLCRTLEQAMVTGADIDALKDAIKHDPCPAQGTAVGVNVRSWINSMLAKAARGTWNISADFAAKVLVEAIHKYYGI